MGMKFLMPRVLDRIVLVSNTLILGLLLMLFATIGPPRHSGSSCRRRLATELSRLYNIQV
jgi:hypothetical protein